MPAGRERDERPREEDDKERPVSPGLNGRACVGTYHGSPSLPVRAPLWTRIPNPCIGDRHAHGTRRRRDALPMLLLLCNVSHPESRVPPAPAQPAARGQAAWSPQPGGRAVLGRVAWTCRIGVIPSLDTGTGTPTVAYLYSPGRTACVVESISSIVSRHFRSDVGQPIRLLSLSLSRSARPARQGRATHARAHARTLMRVQDGLPETHDATAGPAEPCEEAHRKPWPKSRPWPPASLEGRTRGWPHGSE